MLKKKTWREIQNKNERGKDRRQREREKQAEGVYLTIFWG